MTDTTLSPSMIERLTAERLSPDKDGMLMLWERTKTQLTEIKELEMSYRKVCSNLLMSTVDQPKEGVNNIELGGGYVAKVTVKLNYSLDTNNDKVEDALNRIEAIGNEGRFIAERLINWKPTLSVTEYKTLMDDALTSAAKKDMFNIMNEIVTITEGAPVLDIKAPKGK